MSFETPSKRILYLLHQYFPRHVGGTEVFTSGLVARAMAKGYQVQVVTCHESDCSSKDQFHQEHYEYQGASVSEIHFNLSLTDEPSRYEFDNKYTADEVEKNLHEFKPDIVHLMHPMKLTPSVMDSIYRRKIPIILSLADFWLLCPRHSLVTFDEVVCTGPDKFMKCVPCVSRLHGYPKAPANLKDIGQFLKDISNLEIRKSHLMKKILRANRIFALSEFQKKIFVENGYPQERIEVSLHGIEVAHLEGPPPQLSSDGKVRFGFVANIVPVKGLHIAVDAVLKLMDLDIELLVYGPRLNSKYYESIQQKLAQEKSACRNKIKFMHSFEPDEFGRIMRSFDALLMPSLWYENDPLVAKAALFLGIPIIASRIGSLEELIKSNSQGWLVDSRSPDDWANELRRFVEGHPHKIQPRSVRTMDETAAEIFSVYESEIARKTT